MSHGEVLPQPALPDFPPLPDDLHGLTCGAKTRAGTPCKLASLYSNGRCKLHGGLSTGPRTAEGKRKAANNGNAPKRKQSP
ncbi:HGGxSTG domain-containing protein [Crenobacter sp. SG2305]|uniref:HGGxSTG domain-containing protein n=1 Tax=Crenobacter oryzisoli TaxID=3056844 RepID=UPI0025AB5714|nr:HGGxSTG domain-containing protein [Crenobacter sp. SG2305]MDN0083747.1 HGGxSTG domain-containing protein [Crenobacter sp. SG2305]